MNKLNQFTWLLSVIFYNLRLITEDLLIDPLLRKLARLKSRPIFQNDKYEPKQLSQATNFEIKTFAN